MLTELFVRFGKPCFGPIDETPDGRAIVAKYQQTRDQENPTGHHGQDEPDDSQKNQKNAECNAGSVVNRAHIFQCGTKT